MAISFNRIRKTSLAPTDKIPFGIYKGCRVCDVWDDTDYFLWLSKSNPTLFNSKCIDNFKSAKAMKDAARHYDEEVRPYIQDDFDDVPF